MSERADRRRWQARTGARVFLCALVALALWVVTVGAPMSRGAPGVQAAGLASCDVTMTHHVSLASAGGASARLSRTQGVVGTALSLTGSHWPARAAVIISVFINVRGEDYEAFAKLAQGTTAADGSLTIQGFRAPVIDSCVLPPLQSGETVVFLVHTLDNHIQAPVNFTYLTDLGPQVTTTPTAANLAPGEQITMTGARWEPDEHVTITPAIAPQGMQSPQPAIQPLSADAVSITTDSTGAFTVSLPALNESPLTEISFVAEGTGPRYGDVEVDSWTYVMLPKVFPSIHLSAIAVNPGGALMVSGDHWLPHQSGVIEYCRGENTIPGMVGLRCDPNLSEQLGTFLADGSGHFTAQVNFPANARLGSVTVQARAPDSMFGLVVYTQAQPLAIAPTYAEAHPRQAWVEAHWPYFAASALALLTLLVAAAIWLTRRWRGRGGAARAVSGL
jgi:hypothetical protein